MFTGGDPLKRPDLFELIQHSVKLGLRTNVTPSGTPLLTAEATGAAPIAMSLVEFVLPYRHWACDGSR